MKRIYLALTLCLSFGLHAQYVDETASAKKPLKDNVKIAWGSEFKDVKRSVAIQFIGFIDGYGYMLKSKKDHYYVDRLDEQMELVGGTELDLTFQKNELDFEHMIIFHGKLYQLASYKNKGKERKYLFAQELDAETLKPIGEMEKISELSFADGSRRKSGSFEYAYSQDSSLALVLYDVPGNKTSRERFGMQVFKENLELLWEGEAFLPYRETDFDIQDYQLDNEGNVYVLGKLNTGKGKKGMPDIKLEVLKYSKGEEDPTVINVSVGQNKYVSDLYLAFKDNAIICLGFYTNDPNAGAQGCFVQSIDKNSGEVVHQSLQEFELDFITLNTTDKQKKKTEKKQEEGKEVGMRTLTIRQVINHKDQQFVVVAEEYSVQVVTTTTPMAGGGVARSTTTYYHYGDIVMFSFSRDFAIQWYQKIPKDQTTANDGGFYSSFFVQPTDERLLFVYNDHVDNLHVVKAGKPKTFTGKEKNTVAVAATVDYAGNVGKTRLFSAKQEDIFLRPKACGRGLGKQMVIFAQTKSTQRYGKVGLQ